MTTVLIDTDVASYRLRGGPQADRFEPLLRDKLVVVSFVTTAEMLAGAFQRVWGPRRVEALRRYLDRYPTVYPTAATCRLWAEVRTANPARVPAPNDAWIAACAMAEDAEFVTNNVAHFEHIEGLRLLRPANS